jgi:hypothetical protein
METKNIVNTHTYASNCKYLNKTFRLVPTPPLRDVLGGSRRTSAPEGGIAPSYKIKIVNEIEIQYAMKHKLRNVQVIDTIICMRN